MNAHQLQRLFDAIAAVRTLHPNMRLGQLVANAALWAKGPAANVYDLEDDELLAGLLSHIEQHTSVSTS